MSLPPKQLRMTLSAGAAAELGPWMPTSGYRVRCYRSGDEPGWLRLLELAGFEGWDRPMLDAHLAEPERREGSRVVTWCDQIVAASFASQRSTEPPVGGLDYVIGHPGHAGKQLGCAVCAAVIRYLVSRGYEEMDLLTDDWRLPAIKTYLKLGFQPDLVREDMPDRWRAIYRTLGLAREAG